MQLANGNQPFECRKFLGVERQLKREGSDVSSNERPTGDHGMAFEIGEEI
jgi:hypothetical protein